MRKTWLAVTCAGVLASSAAFAADGSIGCYLDDAGTQCSGPVSGPFTMGSVWMNLAGATAAGVTGVEFRIDNSDAGSYGAVFQADPSANISLGNPFLTGSNVAWASCQTGVAGRVKVGQIFITENAPANDVMFTVRQHFTPSNEFQQCPLATLCDAPVYTAVCLSTPNSDHWRAVINPTGAIEADCEPVGVEATSWSTLKALYHN